MKTKRTMQQALELQDGIVAIGSFEAGWNAALASVVQEPGLTEEEIAPLAEQALARIEGVKSWHPHTAASIAHYLAGHIPASKAATQPQEGLTREQFHVNIMAAYRDGVNGHDMGNLEQAWWDQIQAAIAAVRKEATEGNQLTREEQRRVVADLTQQLAEAKKGRYAIDWSKAPTGADRAWTIFGVPQSDWSFLDALDNAWVHGPFYISKNTVLTNKQMETEYLKWLRGTGDVAITMESALGILVKELQRPEIKGDMGLLYRRDVLGGVE